MEKKSHSQPTESTHQNKNNSFRFVYLLGLILSLGTLFYLFSNTFGESLQYYVTVSELVSHKQNYAGKTLKVAGIATEIKTKSDQKLIHEFKTSQGDQFIHVIFEGMVPDTFKENSEVVLTGTYNNDGTFIATNILAKCASKYEAKM